MTYERPTDYDMSPEEKANYEKNRKERVANIRKKLEGICKAERVKSISTIQATYVIEDTCGEPLESFQTQHAEGKNKRLERVETRDKLKRKRIQAQEMISAILRIKLGIPGASSYPKPNHNQVTNEVFNNHKQKIDALKMILEGKMNPNHYIGVKNKRDKAQMYLAHQIRDKGVDYKPSVIAGRITRIPDKILYAYLRRKQ